jgi:hypothetical protein
VAMYINDGAKDTRDGAEDLGRQQISGGNWGEIMAKILC